MADKEQKHSAQDKKPGRSLKEKRAAKNAKQEATKEAHKNRDK